MKKNVRQSVKALCAAAVCIALAAAFFTGCDNLAAAAPSSEKSIHSFSFERSVNPGLTKDLKGLQFFSKKKNMGLIFFKFPSGTDKNLLKALKPTFAASNKAQVFLGKTSSGLDLYSGITATDFSDFRNGAFITVKAENGDELTYNVVTEIDLEDAPESEVTKFFGSYKGVLKSPYLGENKVIIVLAKDKVTLYTNAAGMSMDYENVEWEKDGTKYSCTTYQKGMPQIKNLAGKLGFTFDETGAKIKTKAAIMGTPVTAEKMDTNFTWTPGCGYFPVNLHL